MAQIALTCTIQPRIAEASVCPGIRGHAQVRLANIYVPDKPFCHLGRERRAGSGFECCLVARHRLRVSPYCTSSSSASRSRPASVPAAMSGMVAAPTRSRQPMCVRHQEADALSAVVAHVDELERPYARAPRTIRSQVWERREAHALAALRDASRVGSVRACASSSRAGPLCATGPRREYCQPCIRCKHRAVITGASRNQQGWKRQSANATHRVAQGPSSARIVVQWRAAAP